MNTPLTNFLVQPGKITVQRMWPAGGSADSRDEHQAYGNAKERLKLYCRIIYSELNSQVKLMHHNSLCEILSDRLLFANGSVEYHRKRSLSQFHNDVNV